MKKYTAITVGPIYDTINRARKTREIWAASYLFSKGIMQQFIDKLLKKGLNEKDFIVPYPDIKTDEGLKEIGLFPDRLIVRGNRKDLFKEVSKEVLNALKSEFMKAGCSEEDTGKYLKNYFYINIIEEDIPEGENVIDKISKRLDVSELSQKIIARDPDCITRFLLNITQTALNKDVFGNNRSFPSLIEISTGKMVKDKDLVDRLKKIYKSVIKNDNPDDDILSAIKKDEKLKKYLKQPHKYIAIVQSDGDNVGKLIGNIYKFDVAKLSVFSKALADFARDASKKIKEYGGYPVYAGGDDLLFFAPVLTIDSNIFSLLTEIDEAFNKTILNNNQLNDIVKGMKPKPSMSYGVSITYYKFPLYEARNKAYEMLKRAKKGAKNNIAYYWQKHSGQSFTDTLHKDSGFFEKFKNIIKNQMKTKLISSFIYNLNEHEFILKEIIDRRDRLENYFKNFYDESDHRTKEVEGFKELLIELLISAHAESEKNIEKTLNKVYNTLRFYKFLNEKAQ